MLVFKENVIKMTQNLPSQWLELTDKKQLETIATESETKKVAIFKHSTRCIISRTVLSAFVEAYIETSKEVSVYYLDILNHRDISNSIAEKFSITHESPQLLVIEKGLVKTHASHDNIKVILLD